MNETILANRYEILERIGSGGMALVYKARDTLLGRNVAVKVLRQQFVHDEEFIRRFRREAQSAASLSHPNVVNVYDVGQEGDTHFIVMEYIEGTNLNDVIRENAPLQPSEAVHIATQICDALEHAHSNGIIHRDIKPHNILIGKNGRVKVTDFGIARAITSSTITQTGSVIGSVHYFSPEHAKGVSAGEQSDLYSLGIVMYQMLTAKLPFIGESPVSVALKHLQDDVEEPRVINPMIPQSVENIILKALRKRPEERYAAAGEMLADLETCLSPERRNEPKWAYADDSHDDAEATRVVPAIRPNSRPESASEEEKKSAPTPMFGAPVWRDENFVDEDEQERPANPWIKPLIWFVVLLVLLGASWYGVRALQQAFVIPTVEVPYVVELPLERAQSEIEAAGLEVEEPIVFEFNREVPMNYVISQSKAEGTARIGTSIQLVVSKGVELVEIPDLVGETEEEAVSALEALDIPASRIDISFEHDDAPEGTVIEQFPRADSSVDPLGTTVRLTVSEGPEQVPMPDLIGKTASEAQALLERDNLVLKEENIVKEKEYYPQGKVFKQFPYEPGDPVKPPGEEIMIYVSDGLPDEAKVTEYTVSVGPGQGEQESAIRILVTDAMGDRVEAVNRTISSEQSFSFDVVTSPSKDAVIEVFRNDSKIDQYTWTHRQAAAGGGSARMPASGSGAPSEPASGEPASNPSEASEPAPNEPESNGPAADITNTIVETLGSGG